VSFVLHEVFEIPFGSIAAILGRSTAATKMLASRTRASESGVGEDPETTAGASAAGISGIE
jgi:hypothetical protein